MKKKIAMLIALMLVVLPKATYAQQNLEVNISTEEYTELVYTDGGEEVIPRQKVFGDTARISDVVPQNIGKIFRGWRLDGNKELFKPGQQIKVKDDVMLSAVWEDGKLPELKLKAVSDKDSSVTFSLNFSYGGFMNYASYAVHTRNLTTADENVFEITDGKITIDSLPTGQYKAFLLAKKYDVEYLSDEVNFVVLSGMTASDDTLKLVMDGKDLIFADEQPQLIGSYTYIAIRQFCESMDARVLWREEDRSATITLGGTIIKVFENSNECVVNGTVQTLPVKTIIKNGRMLLPLRSVAEFCNAQIVWDDNRTVYIYRGAGEIFDENMMYIRTAKEEYLGIGEEEIVLTKTPDYGCGWIFDAIDGANGLYAIYSHMNLEKPLQVKNSVITSGQQVIMDKITDFDGHLWRLNRNSDGTFTISPGNNPELFFNAESMCLSENEVVYDINYIGSLEL